MKRHLATILAVTTVLGAAVPAQAETLSIPYSDLNLATDQGQKTLERRIDVAVRQVCGTGRVATGTLVRSAEAKRCYAETKKQVQKQFAAVVDEQRLGG